MKRTCGSLRCCRLLQQNLPNGDLGLTTRSEAALSRLVLSLVCLLAGVHLSVVKLDQVTGRVANAVSRLVVIPPRGEDGRRDLTLLRLHVPARAEIVLRIIPGVV